MRCVPVAEAYPGSPLVTCMVTPPRGFPGSRSWKRDVVGPNVPSAAHVSPLPDDQVLTPAGAVTEQSEHVDDEHLFSGISHTRTQNVVAPEPVPAIIMSGGPASAVRS